MAAGDGATLDNCNLTFESDYFTRPIRGRGLVALSSPSLWGVEVEGWVFRFEIPGRSWTPVKVAQLDFTRVENVTAQCDLRKQMVAQWRTTAWPEQRPVFCRLIVDSRQVHQFFDAFNRAKADAARAEAIAAEAEKQQRAELDLDPCGAPLTEEELAQAAVLMGPAELVDRDARTEWRDENGGAEDCDMYEGWVGENDCRWAWPAYYFPELPVELSTFCARCVRTFIAEGGLPFEYDRETDDY